MISGESSRVTAWRGPKRKSVFGYCNDISVTTGDRLEVKVSCELSHFQASVVRLRLGVDDAVLGRKETVHPSTVAANYPGRPQSLKPGSYVRVDFPHPGVPLTSLTCATWIQPTVCGAGPRGIVAKWCELTKTGFALALGAAGDLECWIGDSNRADRLRSSVPLLPNRWTFVAASVDLIAHSATLIQRPMQRWPGADSCATLVSNVSAREIGDVQLPLLIAAVPQHDGTCNHFDGKIEAPMLFHRALTVAEVEQLMHSSPAQIDLLPDLVAAWDFSDDIAERSVTDMSANNLHGTLVNLPARAVTGHNWIGDCNDWNKSPEQYAAIHFHSDDLEDAGWATDFVIPIDHGYSSGVYAVRLIAGDCEDRIPFVVRPAHNGKRADVGVLLPTLTYQAYANSRAFGGSTAKVMQAEDAFVRQYGLRGLYDYHCDGSPVYYASRLVPSTNRPGYFAQHLNAPARLSADLFLIDWLMEEKIEHDVFTDEDLHRDGVELLDNYRVILTGSHPEYCTKAMLAAIEGYLNCGGNLCLLGAEFGYWVTSICSQNNAVMEVRRGESGSRTQSALPGEYYHSSTGELGGMWRYRGRPAHGLVGVGFTAWGHDKGAGYRRLPASHDPRAAFIFDGIGAEETIGDFGFVLGGAAGYEIDRLDFSLGTPPHTLLLATSEGMHSSRYYPAVEDIMDTATIDAVAEAGVRADMVFFETGFGGAVFSSGSITWTGSLLHNGYRNNVALLTRNVVQRFSNGWPFDRV